MPFQKFKISDDAYGRLWSSISTTTTTITLKSSQNLQDQNCIGTLVQYWLDGYPAKKEKVFVSLNNSNVLTVTRGYDGDTTQTFNEDDYIFFNVVSKIVEDIQDEVSRLETDKANLASPALTWNPTVPTQSQADNSTKIANTEYVRTALANLIASSPAALDTLDELATALGNDANFATTITNALSGKANDSTVVHQTGNELNIFGDKWFRGNMDLWSYDSWTTKVWGTSYDLGGAGGIEKAFQAWVWNGDGSFSPYFTIQRNGNIGIGANTPAELLQIWEYTIGKNALLWFRTWNWSAVRWWQIGVKWWTSDTTGVNYDFSINDEWSPILVVTYDSHDLIMNWQNWTNNWTSYTVAKWGWITGTLSWFNSRYKAIGKVVHVNLYGTFTATANGNYVGLTLPLTPAYLAWAWVFLYRSSTNNVVAGSGWQVYTNGNVEIYNSAGFINWESYIIGVEAVYEIA